jgi:pimeloyl-ACP methyl ester carboxylesterase
MERPARRVLLAMERGTDCEGTRMRTIPLPVAIAVATLWMPCPRRAWSAVQEPTSDVPRATRQSPIRLETTSGTLHGTIDLPSGDGPFPIVIVIAGSGPTDRDGNQPSMKNDSLKLLGGGLAGTGIAALRYDRRGVGRSAAAQRDEEGLRFEMLSDDVVGWVKLLRGDPRFSRVGIVGHSEGSLVGILAANRVEVDAFVSLAGPGRAAPEVLREQLARNLPKALKTESDRIIDELAAGRLVADVPKELGPLFRPSVQPYLISHFKYDPARELSGLEVPVMVVQGTADLQESAEDARRLAAANDDAKLCLIEGMNHVLKSARSRVEQEASYFVPSIPLAPRLIDEMAAFLKDAFR